MKIAIRGWKGEDHVLVFEEFFDFTDERQNNMLAVIAERHAKLLTNSVHMIEIEFLDEPDPMQRFCRFGTDPTRMVRPIGFQI